MQPAAAPAAAAAAERPPGRYVVVRPAGVLADLLGSAELGEDELSLRPRELGLITYPRATPDPMTTAAQDDRDPPPSVLLSLLLEHLPVLFQQEVLRRLGPTDLASLAGAGHGCAAAVAATALMQWAKHAKATFHWHTGYRRPPLCLTAACSNAARGGNQEVLEWLHTGGCPWDAWTTCAAGAYTRPLLSSS